MKVRLGFALAIAFLVVNLVEAGAGAHVQRRAGGQCGTAPCWSTFTINGNAPPAGVTLSLNSSGGQIQISMLRSNNTDLSPSVTTSDAIHMVLNVGSFDPVVYGTTGLVSSFSESIDNVNNMLTIDMKPSASSWNSGGCSVVSCGSDVSPVTATNDFASVAIGFVSNMSSATQSVKDAMRGTWFSTNAQSMTLPSFNATTGKVSFTVAAPHFKHDGSTINSGFFEFFAPDALVTSMGVADPSSVSNGTFTVSSSNNTSTTFSVTHQPSPAGVLIQAGTNPPSLPTFSYSSPTFTVAKAATVPGAPTGVSATAGDGQAVVSFSAPASNGGAAISSYTVTASPGGVTASGSGSPVTVTGLTNGTAYTFTAVATNSVGSSSASSASSAITPAGVPGAPTAVSASAGDGKATVSFTAPSANGSAISSYTVTASPGGATASGSGSPLTVTGLSNGTSYTFTAVATNAVGDSSASSASSAITPAGVPGAPTGVSATGGNGTATVSFSAPSDNGSAISSYTVTASPGGATASGSGGPLTVTGLSNGTSYTFTVTATNAAGTSSASSASSPITLATVPNAPTGVSASAGDGKASVSFSAPGSDGGAAISSYTVTASPGGATASGSSGPITVSGLSNCTSYTFTVTASNSVGASVASSASASVVPAGSAGCATVATSSQATANTSGSLSLPAPSGVAPSVSWSSSTFSSTVNVSAVTEAVTSSSTPPALSGFAAGSVAVELNFTSGGSAVHTFAAPLEIVIPGGGSGFEPSYSNDGGSTWIAIPHLSGTTLPSGQQDGYYTDASGTVHILTMHATYFGLIGDLVLKTWNRTSFPVGSKYVFVYLAPERQANATVVLESHVGASLKSLMVSLPAGSTKVKIPLPAGLKAGTYLVTVNATSGPSSVQRILVVHLVNHR